MIRLLKYILGLSLVIISSGCGGTKCLIDDCNSMDMSSQVIDLEEGESKEILKHKRGLIWGGYTPGFFAVDTNVVSINYSDIRRGHKATVTGKATGSTKVYLVNLYGAGSGVRDSTERAYWLDQLEGSKFYFSVEVE